MVLEMNESNLEVIKMLQKDDLRRHIVFIDSAVDDYPSLVKGVVSGVEVIVLTPTLNGVTQISEVLADRLDIATVHIVSHGSPGCLYLGNTQLSLDTLKCYVTQLQTWFSSLLPQAIAPSLLLYGCNVAAGDAGEEFLERLQQLSGANVAASAKRIGNPAKGGSWHLERHLGEVDIKSAFFPELMQVYSGIFATSSVSNLNNWRLNLERLRVQDAQEESFFSDGDEPYFVVIGFRSRFNTPNSTQTFWSGFLDDDWADGVDDGAQRNIPRQMGSVSFPNVKSVSRDELLSGERLELVGAVAIAFESDATPFSTIRGLVDKLRSTLEGELRRLIEEGQLNPANLGSGISGALNRVKSSIEPSFFEKVKIGLQSFGDPDDLIGIHTFLFAAADPTLANSIPFPFLPNATIGALADRQFRIGNNPIIFSGDGATYEVTTSVSSISVVPPSSAFQVTNTNDSGLGSLRQAIAQANASPGLNTISFVGSVFNDAIPDTVTLTSGQLTISDSLTINGLGADKLTISGNKTSRIFQIENSAIAEINGLTIQNGSADGNGGGIQIASGSTVNINNSSIFDNKAVGSGGGIFLGDNSTLKVISSTISRNETPEDGGGIASNPGAGVRGTQRIILNNVTVSGNTAGEAGGGIEHERGDLLEVRDSTISDNTAKGLDGGGIENDRSILMVINSTISGNRVEAANEDGGGIENDGGMANIINSTISSNQAGRFGGGIDNKGGVLTVTNSTISGNKSTDGGGINNRNLGTGTIGNSIVAGNIATNPATSEVARLSTDTLTSKGFNLVGQNNDTGGFPTVDTDILLTRSIDTAIAPLADNGGSTQTHALISGSPAVNAGNSDNLPLDTFDLDRDSDTNERLPLDQRGQPRIVGSAADIGAFEAPLSTGSGGTIPFVINRGERKTIADFGGIGTGSNPSSAVLAEVDTLKFVGTGLTARNLLLIQNGADLELTFEGDANTKVILQDFALKNLENLSRATGGNILFNGQNSIQDSFDVVNADFKQPRIFNRNTVTFLNDLSNDILGFDNSNDVINGQDGDDIIDGLSGDDLLRGGEGKDFLLGGTGSDILVGGFGDDFLDLGVNRGKDTVVYRSGDGSDTVRNFNRGKGGDLLDFQNIPAIDVVVNGNSTLFRLSDGIKGNGEFGTGDPFLRLSGTTGFTAANLNQNLAAGDTTQFLFT